MTTRFRELICDDEARRAQVRSHATLNGIDYIEVSADSLDEQRFINIFFLKPPPPPALVRFRVEGGVRTRDIRVVGVSQSGDHLVVQVNQPGDFSNYRLILDGPELVSGGLLDPVFTEVEFNFKAGCPSRFDCRPRVVCPPEPAAEPVIDYLAKDYAGFRQALLDLIPSLVPGWTDRHEADLGIALVELLAYAGDQLSYYQDAVANEAYLETSRQRISVRRHARLIDYRMHEGVSARAFVHLRMAAGSSGRLNAGEVQLLSRIGEPLGPNLPPHPPVIPEILRAQAVAAAGVVFETMTACDLDARLNQVQIHSWGNLECCLPVGATAVDLVGDLAGAPPAAAAILKPGDFLLLEEVRGARTGLGQDADPAHRQVVRLTRVERTTDPLLAVTLTRVTWGAADALTFPLCVSVRLDDGTLLENMSVARGNIVLADHGRTIKDEQHRGPRAPIHASLRRAHRFFLNEGPLSFRIPLPKDNGVLAPVKELLDMDPGEASPQVIRVSIGSNQQEWHPVVPDLLDSDPFDTDFVVETDNDGRAQMRFGDGEYGLAPPDEEESNPDDSTIHVSYRVGVGTGGNVGADSLVHVLPNDSLSPTPVNVSDALAGVVGVRNPLPAWGGVDAEPIERVKQVAPSAFHAEQLRAVTEADYARAAERHPEVSRALATFRWTGSWLTVFVTIDPKGRTDVPPELKRRVHAWVTRFTQAGYDLEISPPLFVPLDIEVDVCVSPEHFRGDVEQALLEELSSRTLPGGRRGFFHTENFTFGQALYLSQLYARIKSVDGVDSAVVTKFQRFGLDANNELARGFIPMNRLEIVRLDNDPNSPESGVLRLNMLGGK